jgi:hypothetical protein
LATDGGLRDQIHHSVVVSWVSKTHRGMYQSVYNWAVHGGPVADPDARKKAAECLELLKPLGQPKDLPESPNRIVTVRCLDGDSTLVKKFPIDQVPLEVYQILAVMGYGDEQLNGLKFIRKPSLNQD